MIHDSGQLKDLVEGKETQQRKRAHSLEEKFGKLSVKISRKIGSSWSFGVAVLSIVLWAGLGPLFHYSSGWQLVINTGTGLVTFLILFILQNSQNRESMAAQLKLNEIIASVEGASNRMIDIEKMDQEDLEGLKHRYQNLVEKLSHRQTTHSTSVAEVNDVTPSNIKT